NDRLRDLRSNRRSAPGGDNVQGI
ncbi:MAG TPA: Hpt domain-containing protein, partial [Cupriavidus sp.]|nr:Hpt domain-containing protein [Cupriavidus sp.]